MTNNVYVGVDVSKNILDTLFRFPAGQTAEQRSFSNAKTGRKKLISRLSQMPGVHVVMEATASYHLGLMYDLNEADIPFMVVNPFCAKAYGRSKNLRSKSDTIDANTLAEFGSERPFIPTQMPSDNQLKIRQLASVIRLLTKHRTATKNSLRMIEQMPVISSDATKELKKIIALIDKAIARATEVMKQLVLACHKETLALINSVKGVGLKTTLILISYLGDLDSFQSAKQVAHFMGLGNVDNQSGQRTRPRRISKRGHPELRSLMFLCALSAARHNTSCRDLYQRLMAKGKPKKVALIAVANKLVRQIFAVVKNKTPFENNYLEKASISLAS